MLTVEQFFAGQLKAKIGCHSEHIRFTQCKLREESAFKVLKLPDF